MSLLGDPRWALPTLAVVGVWKLTGYAMIVFLAGLQGVPRSLLEAAALDGAGAWARFRHVTMPLLAPTAAFVATTSLVTSFQAFDVVRIMTQGGPARATELFVYAIYEQIFLEPQRRPRERADGGLLRDAARRGGAAAARVAGRGEQAAMRAVPRAARCSLLALACVAAAAWLLPYAWMVLTSFKTLPEIVAAPDGAAARSTSTPGAYREVFATIPVGRYMGVTIFMAVAIACRADRARPARRATRSPSCASSGRRFAFGAVLACLLVPAQATFVPVFLLFAQDAAWSTR